MSPILILSKVVLLIWERFIPRETKGGKIYSMLCVFQLLILGMLQFDIIMIVISEVASIDVFKFTKTDKIFDEKDNKIDPEQIPARIYIGQFISIGVILLIILELV